MSTLRDNGKGRSARLWHFRRTCVPNKCAVRENIYNALWANLKDHGWTRVCQTKEPGNSSSQKNMLQCRYSKSIILVDIIVSVSHHRGSV